MIRQYKAGREVAVGNDRDLSDAFFLHHNPGWKPEDLGYPKGDFILVDLMRLMGKA